MEKTNLNLVLLIALVAVLSAAAGISLWNLLQHRQAPDPGALIILPEPRQITDFSLTDQNGQEFTLDQLRGQWTLVFFGFTHCPDVCPSTLYDLQLVHNEIMQRAGDKEPLHQVLFVSVDPDRDTPQQLKDYLAFFSPDFIGVTGDHSQLGPFSLQLSTAYRVEEHEAGQTQYNVDHSAAILLISPDGRLHGVFPAPHDAQMISADLAAVID